MSKMIPTVTIECPKAGQMVVNESDAVRMLGSGEYTPVCDGAKDVVTNIAEQASTKTEENPDGDALKSIAPNDDDGVQKDGVPATPDSVADVTGHDPGDETS